MRLRGAGFGLAAICVVVVLGALVSSRSTLAAGGSGGLAPAPPLVLVSRANGLAGRPSTAAGAGTISADGRYAAFTDGGEIFIRDVRTNRTRRVGEGDSPILSADTGLLAYGSDGKAFVCNLRTGVRSPVSTRLSTSAGSISADGRYVALSFNRFWLICKVAVPGT